MSPPSQLNEANKQCQCQRCIARQVECVTDPTGACQECFVRKEKCSLVPMNPETGKADRHILTPEAVFEYRVKQAKALRAEIRKGKRRAVDSPDADEPEASEEASPALSSLAGLERLTLGGGKPSPGSTPADSPANMPQPPLPEQPAPPSSAPKTRKRSKPSPSKCTFKCPVSNPTQHSTDPTIEAPTLLDPVHRQVSRSSGNASPARDTQILSNTERISAIEAKLESMQQDFDSRLKKLGG